MHNTFPRLSTLPRCPVNSCFNRLQSCSRGGDHGPVHDLSPGVYPDDGHGRIP